MRPEDCHGQHARTPLGFYRLIGRRDLYRARIEHEEKAQNDSFEEILTQKYGASFCEAFGTFEHELDIQLALDVDSEDTLLMDLVEAVEEFSNAHK